MAILDNDFSSSILDGAALAAKETDSNLFVFPMDILDADYSEVAVNTYRYQYNVLSGYLDNKSFDGIVIEYGTIVSALNDEKKAEFLSKIGDTPVVLLAEKSDRFPYVCVDNKAGLIEVITHLVEFHKCKKIGYISGPKENYDSIERLNVYKDTMAEYGLFNEDYVRYGNFSEYIREQIEDLLKSHPDIEAIVCANDAMAMGACAYLKEMGKVVGEDIIVTGFDDIVPAFLHIPALTTIKAAPNELSYEAVISLVNGTVKKKHTIPSKLVVRESCGCTISEQHDSKKKELGITADWRINAKRKLDENIIRTKYEHELSNITREMVFSDLDDSEKYKTVLNTFKRLNIKSGYLYLYDDYVLHRKNDNWEMPSKLSLVANFQDDIYHTCLRGEDVYDTKTLFLDKRMQEGRRRDFVMIPLFFGENQIGQLLCETEPDLFKFVFILAGQFSNSLAIVDMNARQERMKRELEEISMYKSQFLANMSHEIRTPINAIIGFNEMILREASDDNISDYATDVKNASENLLSLVNDILDFSKIEAGKMTIINNNYSMKDLMTGVVDIVKDRADKKNLKLNLIVDERVPSVLYGDKARINQILLNLLSNAIKYTETGEVTVEVSLGQITGDEISGSAGDCVDAVKSAGGSGMTDASVEVTGAADGVKTASLTFSVKDTGIGIKEEDISDLFVKFKRIEENRNRNIEGTGLGINIVASLLFLMDSKLLVESTYNVGSRFYFTLEQKVVDATPVGKVEKNRDRDLSRKVYRAPYKAPSARILVVDDNGLNRKVIKKLLSETEMFVDTADSGLMCIEKLQEDTYDVVLLDHMMPQMDGIETLAEIRDKGIISKDKTKIIALTANAIIGAKEMYMEAGFDDYLSKPVRVEDLNNMLLKCIDESKIQRS